MTDSDAFLVVDDNSSRHSHCLREEVEHHIPIFIMELEAFLHGNYQRAGRDESVVANRVARGGIGIGPER